MFVHFILFACNKFVFFFLYPVFMSNETNKLKEMTIKKNMLVALLLFKSNREKKVLVMSLYGG